MSFTVMFEPVGVKLICDEAVTVADACRRAGTPLRSECGGKATCGKCRVLIVRGAPSEPTEAEAERLTAEELSAGWRLSCRAVLSGETTVYIPEPTWAASQVAQTEGLELQIKPKPSVRSLFVHVSPPSLSDQTADLDRVAGALRDQHGVRDVRVDLPALRVLREALRDGGWQVCVVLRDDEIIAAFPGAGHPTVGLAVDVGTTKLACYLVDLESGKTLSAKGIMNPQIAFGEDVMSRLERAMVDPGDALRLQHEGIAAINAAAAELCAANQISPDSLADLCLVGNTAMHHLLLGLPVRYLALSPFVPALSRPLDIEADQLGLHVAPGAHVYLPPPIAGFVGSDHLAFLLAADFDKDDRVRIGIDIGTNTEIALQAKGRIVSCSTASGPAFEGAHIQHGMRASPGAVEKVRIAKDGSVSCQVIGGGPAAGICGSGVLDALAEMREAGIVNLRGRISPQAPGAFSDQEGTPSFLLVGGNHGGRDITLSQKDVDQVLLAKGAIRAGIDILMRHLDIMPQDLEEVVIAGAFGSYLDPRSAVRIGLLPPVHLPIVHAVGNAAGAGARLMLASTEARLRAADLRQHVEYLELTVVPGFNRYFAQGVRLPESRLLSPDEAS